MIIPEYLTTDISTATRLSAPSLHSLPWPCSPPIASPFYVCAAMDNSVFFQLRVPQEIRDRIWQLSLAQDERIHLAIPDLVGRGFIKDEIKELVDDKVLNTVEDLLEAAMDALVVTCAELQVRISYCSPAEAPTELLALESTCK